MNHHISQAGFLHSYCSSLTCRSDKIYQSSWQKSWENSTFDISQNFLFTQFISMLIKQVINLRKLELRTWFSPAFLHFSPTHVYCLQPPPPPIFLQLFLSSAVWSAFFTLHSPFLAVQTVNVPTNLPIPAQLPPPGPPTWPPSPLPTRPHLARRPTIRVPGPYPTRPHPAHHPNPPGPAATPYSPGPALARPLPLKKNCWQRQDHWHLPG